MTNSRHSPLRHPFIRAFDVVIVRVRCSPLCSTPLYAWLIGGRTFPVATNVKHRLDVLTAVAVLDGSIAVPCRCLLASHACATRVAVTCAPEIVSVSGFPAPGLSMTLPRCRHCVRKRQVGCMNIICFSTAADRLRREITRRRFFVSNSMSRHWGIRACRLRRSLGNMRQIVDRVVIANSLKM